MAKAQAQAKSQDGKQREPRVRRQKTPKKRSHHPLLNRLIIILFLAVLLTGAIAVLFTPLAGGPWLSLPFSLVQSQQESSVSTLLEEVRDISRIQTLEYIHRLVFPHDFLRPEISLAHIFSKMRSARSGQEPSDYLTPDELLYFQAYNLALAAGLEPLHGDFDFLVITVIVELGYDLGEVQAPGESRESGDGSYPRFEALEADETGRGRIRVSLPPASVLGVRIEDPESASYPYPDVSLTQEHWRLIAAFVGEQVEGLPEIQELQQLASESMKDFLKAYVENGMNLGTEFVTIDG